MEVQLSHSFLDEREENRNTEIHREEGREGWKEESKEAGRQGGRGGKEKERLALGSASG